MPQINVMVNLHCSKLKPGHPKGVCERPFGHSIRSNPDLPTIQEVSIWLNPVEIHNESILGHEVLLGEFINRGADLFRFAGKAH
jgi:hypothetical protein